MQKLILSILLLTVFVGCSTRESSNQESPNAYDEHREEQDRRNVISERYQEREDAYTEDFDDITFTGDPNDFNNVVLEVNRDRLSLGIPRLYQFIEREDHLELHVIILSEENDNIWGSEEIEETLVVDDINYEDDMYTIHAEDYTFELETFQDSVNRLRDENDGVLNPAHYIPEDLQEKWLQEAEEEVEAEL